MAEFVLQPCKVRENRLVPVKDADLLRVDFAGLASLVIPASPALQYRSQLAKLILLRAGAFVGQTTMGTRSGLFLLLNADRSNKLNMAKDRRFADRITCAYKVISADWGEAIREMGVSGGERHADRSS